MATRFVIIDRDTPLLLPPDLRDWVPSSHLVHFVIDAMDAIDTRSCRVNPRGTGSAQYPPSVLLSLLVYSYATGVFPSRQIERSTHENVAVRLLCADTHPDHDTVCTFRRENAALLKSVFAQILEMAARCQVLKVGNITLAIDGTKVLANASKHAAVSYAHAEKTMQLLDQEIEQLLAKAEDTDAVPLQDGLSIPDEVQRRQQRKALLANESRDGRARIPPALRPTKPTTRRSWGPGRPSARAAASREAKIRCHPTSRPARAISSTSPTRPVGSCRPRTASSRPTTPRRP